MCLAYIKSPFFLAGGAAFSAGAAFLEVVKTSLPKTVGVEKVVSAASPVFQESTITAVGNVFKPMANSAYMYLCNSNPTSIFHAANGTFIEPVAVACGKMAEPVVTASCDFASTIVKDYAIDAAKAMTGVQVLLGVSAAYCVFRAIWP